MLLQQNYAKNNDSTPGDIYFWYIIIAGLTIDDVFRVESALFLYLIPLSITYQVTINQILLKETMRFLLKLSF